MDHLGVDSGYIRGLSMGGMIALQFALTYPQRVKALLLCDTAASNRRIGGLQRGSPEEGGGDTVRRFIFRDIVPVGFVLARNLPLVRFLHLRDAPEGGVA